MWGLFSRIQSVSSFRFCITLMAPSSRLPQGTRRSNTHSPGMRITASGVMTAEIVTSGSLLSGPSKKQSTFEHLFPFIRRIKSTLTLLQKRVFLVFHHPPPIVDAAGCFIFSSSLSPENQQALPQTCTFLRTVTVYREHRLVAPIRNNRIFDPTPCARYRGPY